VGAIARDGRRIRRSADLRVAQLDHVLAEVLLLLRAAEEELSRTLRVSRPAVESAAGAAKRASSKSKFYNIIQLRHRDEVEAPVTEWLREAYEHSESLATRRGGSQTAKRDPLRASVRPA
jgi:hypothetical protein